MMSYPVYGEPFAKLDVYIEEANGSAQGGIQTGSI